MSIDKLLNVVDDKGCYVIAEVGLNHNGSVDVAKRLIDLAAIAEADAVKFQKRTVDKLAIGEVLDAKDDRFPEFGSTYRDVREYLEFGFDQYLDLKQYAEDKGLDFLVTSFDTDAVDFLEDVGVEAYKLASHSLTNIELLQYLAPIGKPIILSTGMAEIEEIQTAVDIFKQHKTPVFLLHCVSAYPTPLEDCNLQMINTLKEKFDLPVGYSGHELGYLPTISAVAMGAVVVERHYTLNNKMTGFDHKISLEPDEFISMMRDIRNIGRMLGSGEKKLSKTEWITRKKYHVSMTSACSISAGTVLAQEMVTYRNPGTGIPAKNASKILGLKATRDIDADELLELDMFE